MQSRRSSRNSAKRQRVDMPEEDPALALPVEGSTEELKAEIKRLRVELQQQIEMNAKLNGELKDQLRKNEELQEQLDNSHGHEPKKSQSRYWSKEEHQRFLDALEKYGRKDVKSISAYVGTRTPTQVRTHAQKYFLKMKNEDSIPVTPSTKKRKAKDMDELSPGYQSPGSPNSSPPRSPGPSQPTVTAIPTALPASPPNPQTPVSALNRPISPLTRGPVAGSPTSPPSPNPASNGNARSVYMFPTTYNAPPRPKTVTGEQRRIVHAFKAFETEKDYTTKLELIQQNYFPLVKLDQLHVLAQQAGIVPAFQPPPHKHHSGDNLPELAKPTPLVALTPTASSATSAPGWAFGESPTVPEIQIKKEEYTLGPQQQALLLDHLNQKRAQEGGRTTISSSDIGLVASTLAGGTLGASGRGGGVEGGEAGDEPRALHRDVITPTSHHATSVLDRGALSSPGPVPVPSPSPLTSAWATHDIYAQKMYSPLTMYLNSDFKEPSSNPIINSASLQMLADSMPSTSGFALYNSSTPTSTTTTTTAPAGGEESGARHSLAEDEEDEELRELNKHHKPQPQPLPSTEAKPASSATQQRKTSLQDVIGRPVSISPHIFSAALDGSILPGALPSSPPPFSQSPFNPSTFL